MNIFAHTTTRANNQILKKLLKTNAFWSFDKKTISIDSISDNSLIENTFIHCDIDEIKLLFKIFSNKKLLSVWNERLVPDKRYYKLNYYLGVCFFNISDTKKHITETAKKYSRYEKIKQLAKTDARSIY